MITDNDVFWNNFNVHAGAPFKPKKTGVVPLVPIGTGILLLGGRTNRVEDNRVYGNYLVGVAAVEGILLDKTTEARALIGNQITRQRVRARRRGPQRPRPRLRRQRHAATAGARTPACRPRCPADAGDVPGLPVRRAPTRSARTRRTSMSASRAPNALKGWIKHPHKAKAGYTPLEVYKK